MSYLPVKPRRAQVRETEGWGEATGMLRCGDDGEEEKERSGRSCDVYCAMDKKGWVRVFHVKITGVLLDPRDITSKGCLGGWVSCLLQ